MMKKNTILAVIFLSLSCGLWAQTMSDQAVIKAVLEYQQRGMSSQDMAKALIQQGATIEQLQRLQQLQQQGVQSSTASFSSAATTNLTRTLETNENILMGEFLDIPPRKTSNIFGHDIFFRAVEGFEPSVNQATPQNYTLGAGDKIQIDIYGASQEQFNVTISPDGNVTIPGYGPIHIGGLTVQSATRKLKSTLGSRYQQSQMIVSLGQTRSISVQVMGEVEMPGSYQLNAFATVFTAIYKAGGITDMGTLRSIKLYRQNQLQQTIDLYTYLTQGSMEGNTRLEDGDAIIVGAYEELVTISGKVKRPMSYEMKKDETLDKLIALAGGFSGNAYTDAVRVTRRNMGAMSVSTIRNAQFDQFGVLDGDSVQVDSILPRFKNTVAIKGCVFRPGQYGLTDEMRTLTQLLGMADGPMEQAYLQRAVLYRMKLDRTFQAIPIDLEDIINGKGKDIELRNEDELFIPSKQEQLENQYVVIHGEVYHPNTYVFAENERVEDLILRAGGLTERASVSKVDIARRVIDPQANEESKIKSEVFTVALDPDMNITDKGFILQPFDEVFIRQSPAYGKQMNVLVRGEILFGGTYTMKTQDDRLSDLVKAAGGLTSHAHIKGARLLRTETEEERLRREQMMKITKASNSHDSINIEKLDLGSTYYVGIDLEAALAHPGSNEDIILREGDILIIPTINTSVKINGEVLYPNTVSYITDKRAKYYINQAGGFSNMARKCKTYVIYANGKVAPAYRAKIEPGCTIIVPTKPERKAGNTTQAVAIASASASGASAIATLATLVINLTNNNK